jgi:putative acetyltransferase
MLPTVRPYRISDTKTLCRLFYDTVHRVNRMDYSPSEIAAWAPQVPDAEIWRQRMDNNVTLVAEIDGEIAGFGELADGIHIHMLFCHSDYIDRGVGSTLLTGLESASSAGEGASMTTFSSLTARAFFEKHGYQMMARQKNVRGDVVLVNFRMEKRM